MTKTDPTIDAPAGTSSDEDSTAAFLADDNLEASDDSSDTAPSAADTSTFAGAGAAGPAASGSSGKGEPQPHDFTVAGSWLNGGRSEAFQQSLHDAVRITEDVLELWTSRVNVEADAVATITLARLAEESLHYVEFELDESGQSAFLMFDTRMALSIATLMMGGNGDPGETRALTSLEAGLLCDLALAMCEQFARELHLGPVRFKAHHSDQTTMRDGVTDVVMSFLFNLANSKASGTCRLAVSPLSLQAHMEIIDRRINGRRRSETPSGSAASAALRPVVVPVIVGFACIRVPAIDMASLQPGDVLRTGQSLGRQLVASVGNAPVFTVKAGQRGDRLVAEVLSVPQHDISFLSKASTDASSGAAALHNSPTGAPT